jgi:hypothetical protein
MNTLLRTLGAACLVATALTATACQALPNQTLSQATYTMQPGDSVPVGPEPITLRYERANDSRCPPGVQCIWAGTISYEFTLIASAATEAFALTPEKPGFSSSLVPGVRISLGKFDPPPVPPVGEPKPVYPVTIVVDRD